MRSCVLKFVFAIALFQALISPFNLAQGGVKFSTQEAKKRVDVLIDGSLFTAYRWDADLKKPILYPINTARGTVITRGFPLDPRPGESVDHPHQSGLWLNYGDVNGIDFWNNSTVRTPDEVKHMGTIVHRRIVSARNGQLSVEADWLMPDGKAILREATRYIFRGRKNSRSIDRITKLTALKEKVVFNDSKEGLFGLRVRRELEQPAKDPILLTGTDGKVSEKPVLDNKNVFGEFRSSDGKTGDDVWGTRAKWTTLTGRIGGEDITIAIFDHPKNTGFPAHAMARGYGLFAINPLGTKVYGDAEALNFTLEPGRSVTFHYRVLIASQKLTDVQTESSYRDFIKPTR